WILEGAKFDGTDAQAKAPLRSLVPTDAERLAKELAALTPEQLAERRKARGSELWRNALASQTPVEAENDGFYVLGNVNDARLREIAHWAEQDAATLKKVFAIKDPLIWRGRLTVYVFADRFSYAEFVQSIEQAEVPREIHGHARVTAALDQGYVCVEDVGDDPMEAHPGMRALLLNLLAEAMLQRSSNKIPDWAARGVGLAIAAREDPKNPYFRALAGAAHEAAKSLSKPEDVFSNGSFSPADIPAVGFTLVTHMMKVGGEPQFVKFLNQLSAGKSLAEALQTVYSADPGSLARSYLAGLATLKPVMKKGAKAKP
ncbi:MAG: hypothetical protein ACKV0T_25695, partial [Planctomycetales bacterium]